MRYNHKKYIKKAIEGGIMQNCDFYDIDLVINEMKRLPYPEDCINYYRIKKNL